MNCPQRKDRMTRQSARPLVLAMLVCALLGSCVQNESDVPEMQRERYRQRLAVQREAESQAQARADAQAKRESAAATTQPIRGGPSRVTIDENHVLVVNGSKLFPI